MPLYRAYIDKEIVTDAKGISTGGEHSRAIEGEADDVGAFEASLKLRKDEALGQIVSYSLPNTDPAVLKATEVMASIAEELHKELDIDLVEANRLAQAAVTKAGLE